MRHPSRLRRSAPPTVIAATVIVPTVIALLLAAPVAFAGPTVAASSSLGLPVAVPGPAAATATSDSDRLSVRRRFDAGLKALRARKLQDAVAVFDSVASSAQLAERRAAAASLSRYAMRLQALGVAEPPADDPSAGRTGFIVMSTVTSLYAGVVILDIMDNNDARAGAAVLLATTGIGLAGSLLGSRGMRITESTGDAYSIGIVYGLTTGGLLSLAVDVDTSEAAQVSMLVGMGLGGAASFLLADALHPTRGQVNFVGTAMVMGFSTTALSLVATQPKGLESTTLAWMLLGGLQVGTLVGAFVAEDVDWSLSRSRLVMLGALVGGLVGGGTAVLFAGDNIESQGIAGATLAGLWGGFGLAAWLTEDMTPDAKYRAPGLRSALVPTILPGGRAGLAWAGRF